MVRSVRTALPLLLACAALTLAACGSDAGTGGGSGSESPSPSATPSASPTSASPTSSAPASPTQPAAGAATALTVEFAADGSSTSDTWTLQCDGAAPLPGSNVPDPAAACAVLAEQGAAAFAEAAGDRMCTQNIAGMQRAHVTGTVNGEAVDTSFALTDGCQISRWENLTALLGPAEGTF